MGEKPVGTAMQPRSWRNGCLLLACTVLLACGSHSKSNNAEALVALKNLRDQGVLTQAEYDAKVAALGDAAAGGLGAGGGVDPGAAAPRGADGLPAASDTGAGLAAGSNEFAGGAPAPAQHLSRAARTRAVTVGEPAAADAGSAGLAPNGNAAGNSGNANSNSRASAMRNLLAQARAREAAVARSAHDLALRMLQRAPPANAGAPQVPNAQDAQALRAYGQALMHGANPADAAAASDQADDAGAPPR
jgi:hypothetical protein